ncbi:MAG: STAS domain-containing protein [Streptosporangiaceae bacterium]|nr:STAS domain-containing protein [Streptosporangiaceae bacterium]
MKTRTVISSPHLVIMTEHHRRRLVLRLVGELDVGNRDLLRNAISRALEDAPQMLVVDLSSLDFMDCSGLGVLVKVHEQLTESQRQLVITGSQPIVRRLIRLTGLDTYLRLAEQHHPGTPDSPAVMASWRRRARACRARL